MDINAGILEQMLQGSTKKFSSILPFPDDPEKRKSAAFVIFCMSKRLDISFEEAAEYYTDGGNDTGIDGLYIDDVNENTIRITLFQGNYSRNLDGADQFPLNGIEKIISTVRNIFDPFQEFTIKGKIRLQLEEVRSYVMEGVIPIVYVVLCNNGQHWNALAQEKLIMHSFQ